MNIVVCYFMIAWFWNKDKSIWFPKRRGVPEKFEIQKKANFQSTDVLFRNCACKSVFFEVSDAKKLKLWIAFNSKHF